MDNIISRLITIINNDHYSIKQIGIVTISFCNTSQLIITIIVYHYWCITGDITIDSCSSYQFRGHHSLVTSTRSPLKIARPLPCPVSLFATGMSQPAVRTSEVPTHGKRPKPGNDRSLASFPHQHTTVSNCCVCLTRLHQNQLHFIWFQQLNWFTFKTFISV